MEKTPKQTSDRWSWRTLFQSRRVVLALASLVVGGVIITIPELDAVRSELIILVGAILMVALGVPPTNNGDVDLGRLLSVLDAVADELGLDLDDTLTEDSEEDIHATHYP